MKNHRNLVSTARLAIAAIVISSLGCDRTSDSTPDLEEATVQTVCGSCHAFPDPSVLPRWSWRAQIERMAVLVDYVPSTTDVPHFDVEDYVTWYESRAPEHQLMEQPITPNEPGPLRFGRRSMRLGQASGPGVATVSKVEAGLAVANMALGSVHLLSLAKGPRLIGDAGHPARIAEADLDGNGMKDLLIADLGDPMPTDDPTGRVLVAFQSDDGEFELKTLVEGIGRVSDVRPIDLDLDGDLDLVVASFGFLREGGVYVLRRQSSETLEFKVERVTNQAGAVSVIVVNDLLPDTGPGFVVAFAQELESVSLFLPRGPGEYEERVLYRAPHPAWGTSHLSSADLDGDGDLDFIVSNGDTLDDGVAFKPYQGIRWLENRGTGEFRPHLIGRIYGASATEAADLDGDGDLDIIASGFLAQIELPVPANAIRLDSVVWFERDGDDWNPWEIESGHPRHTGLTVIDLDDDGRLDVVAAVNRAWDATPVEEGPSLEVWFNQGPRTSANAGTSGRPRREDNSSKAKQRGQDPM